MILRIWKAKVPKKCLTQYFSDNSDDAILILQNTKKTTCDVPGCVAGANKSQTYIIQVGLIARVYVVLCVLEYTCTFLSWKLLFE